MLANRSRRRRRNSPQASNATRWLAAPARRADRWPAAAHKAKRGYATQALSPAQNPGSASKPPVVIRLQEAGCHPRLEAVVDGLGVLAHLVVKEGGGAGAGGRRKAAGKPCMLRLTHSGGSPAQPPCPAPGRLTRAVDVYVSP